MLECLKSDQRYSTLIRPLYNSLSFPSIPSYRFSALTSIERLYIRWLFTLALLSGIRWLASG